MKTLETCTITELAGELARRIAAGGKMRLGTVCYSAIAECCGREIVMQVAREFGIGVMDVMGRDRRAKVARARQVAMAGMWMAGFTYPEVGRFFERDHVTVMHAVKRTGAIRKTQETKP